MTINSIFSETILDLLRIHGPLSTKEIHPLVKSAHPNLCDDQIDRIIDGKHFGKKWKHYVRAAQESLSRDRNLIYRSDTDGKWHLVQPNPRPTKPV